MSTIIVRIDSEAKKGTPRRMSQVLIDGKAIGGNIEMTVDGPLAQTIPDSPITWTLFVDGDPVMSENIPPERRTAPDGMIEYVWINVGVWLTRERYDG